MQFKIPTINLICLGTLMSNVKSVYNNNDVNISDKRRHKKK